MILAACDAQAEVRPSSTILQRTLKRTGLRSAKRQRPAQVAEPIDMR
jgi:hypothetical protein